jgi:MFS transporter, OCT family, solute carrier family 22 (organic cation transporter), member 4/5
MHFAGIMFGSGIFGFFADLFGRKKIFIIATMFMALTGIGQAISTNYLMFLSFAFLNAVGTSGVYPLAFVIGVEMVGKKKREMAGVVLNYFYSIGEALVGVIAWLDPSWVNLQLWVSAPPLLFITYYWFIPESIRWLIAKKFYGEALEVMKQAAEQNGKVLSRETLEKFDDENLKRESYEMSSTIRIKATSSEAQLVDTKPMTYLDLIKSRTLLLRCLILFFIWGTNAFVFYGLSLNSINLSGNIYLNFILGCLIEIPGNTIAWFIINKFGRKLSLSCSLLICGVTCITGGFVPEKIFWIQIILFLVGKMAITSAFTVVYVYSGKIEK